MVDYNAFYKDPQIAQQNALQNYIGSVQYKNAMQRQAQQDAANQNAMSRRIDLQERQASQAMKSSGLDDRQKQMAIAEKQLDFLGRGLGAVKDERSYQQFRGIVSQMTQSGMLEPVWYEQMPQNYDPQKTDEARMAINSFRQQISGGGGFTLGPGQIRYDESGREVARGEEKRIKTIERTVDLGDKIEYVYSDGTKEYKKKGKTPNSTAGVDQRRISDEMKIRKEFSSTPEVKNFVEIDSQAQRLDKAIEQAKMGGSMVAVDQALITILNKMLDPSSVVRESEYARTPNDLAFLNRMRGKIEKLNEGGAGLTDEDRQAIAEMARSFYNVAEGMYNQQVKYYTDLSKRYGYSPENIVRLGGLMGGESYETKENEPQFKILKVE